MQTQTYIVSSTDVFRKLAKTIPAQTDIVLEIGSSLGLATAILSKSAGQVFGIEHSKDMITELEARLSGHSNVQLLWHDARDIHGLLDRVPRADIIFFDIGGDAPAHQAIYILGHYINSYRPRAAVVRNISLAAMLGNVRLTEFPEISRYKHYRKVPSKNEILEHYEQESKRSGSKFVERERKKRRDPED